LNNHTPTVVEATPPDNLVPAVPEGGGAIATDPLQAHLTAIATHAPQVPVVATKEFKIYAVRKSCSLFAPALFFHWDDARFYIEENNASDIPVEYRCFQNFIEAMKYLVDPEIYKETVKGLLHDNLEETAKKKRHMLEDLDRRRASRWRPIEESEGNGDDDSEEQGGSDDDRTVKEEEEKASDGSWHHPKRVTRSTIEREAAEGGTGTCPTLHLARLYLGTEDTTTVVGGS
jgi:hypothetical protein